MPRLLLSNQAGHATPLAGLTGPSSVTQTPGGVDEGDFQQGLTLIQGGFATKIHICIHAMGMPIMFAPTGAEGSDFKRLSLAVPVQSLSLPPG